ncbi:hypothetical protein BC937DRAFT_88707 [Endogone sp. FLAS-F59071]|nr:hypothetical protein BC937DRAFT_88707 [Endogone sp. FLAS-F59071]|eukprot:RUS18495.1 hypothetical protein BC937DRAFT_88707 [Endogone sp. FLAS-F59071]
MSARLIAQLIVSVGAVVGRAFIAAYKQAAVSKRCVKFTKMALVQLVSGTMLIIISRFDFADAAQGGGAGAAREGGKSAADVITRQTGLTIDEACQILNVKKDADIAEVVKKYEHLFKSNDSSVGGSFYLQSKVVRAKERFELEQAGHAKRQGKESPTSGEAEEAKVERKDTPSSS